MINITGNLVEQNVKGVGYWGGTCICPDGSKYEVGDNKDSCQTLACIHGTKLNCNKYDGAWSKRKVTCHGNLRRIFIAFMNDLIFSTLHQIILL